MVSAAILRWLAKEMTSGKDVTVLGVSVIYDPWLYDQMLGERVGGVVEGHAAQSLSHSRVNDSLANYGG